MRIPKPRIRSQYIFFVVPDTHILYGTSPQENIQDPLFRKISFFLKLLCETGSIKIRLKKKNGSA